MFRCDYCGFKDILFFRHTFKNNTYHVKGFCNGCGRNKFYPSINWELTQGDVTKEINSFFKKKTKQYKKEKKRSLNLNLSLFSILE